MIKRNLFLRMSGIVICSNIWHRQFPTHCIPKYYHWTAGEFGESRDERKCCKFAVETKAEFLNAGCVISTDCVDGLHLEPICDYHTFGKLFCVIFGAIFLLLRYLAATLLKDGCVLPQTKAGCGVAWDKHAVEHYRLR